MNSKRIIGWLFAILALLLLQACSAIKLAYNNSPEFGYWWIDGYVDIQSEQTPKVRDELTRLLAWHRCAIGPGSIAPMVLAHAHARS